MKYLLGSVLSLALTMNANAAISTFNGTNVTWGVDFESGYFKGLQAIINGDSLIFTKNGSAIVQSAATGLGTQASTAIRYSNANPSNPSIFSDFITVKAKQNVTLKGFDIQVQGNNFYNLVSDHSNRGEITNSLYGTLSVYDPINKRYEPSANSSQRDKFDTNVKNDFITSDNGLRYKSGGGQISNGNSPDRPSGVNDQLKEAQLYLYLEAKSEIKYGGQLYPSGPQSIAEAQMNSFSLNALSAPVAPIPEPETYALMGMGLVGLLAARRHKAKQA